MNRTFHHKISVQSVACVVLFGVAALWCLLVRTGVMPVAGALCLFLGATAVDRMVGTTYTFTPGGVLHIVRGRTGGRQSIDVDTIVAVRRVRGSIVRPPHIVIEYGASGRMTSVQPADFAAFEAEIRRRQTAADGEENEES